MKGVNIVQTGHRYLKQRALKRIAVQWPGLPSLSLLACESTRTSD